MSASRFGRLQKATALVPLAMLSAAMTAGVAGVGAPTAVSSQEDPATLPDGTTLPTEAIEAPASVSRPIEALSGGLGGASARRILATASASGIPAAALAAYQRAETVINAADKSCNISWQLIAAIGRVESNHGRANGNTLTTEGLATPGIYGIALNGSRNTAAISDTDAGQFDNDTQWDRAIGPMQFIPSTWSVVGVDADNDGERNPQDIDDAALGSAVYLCSGEEDLSTRAGQEAAVFRYNHSKAYVDLVLSIMDAYLTGDFTSVPSSTVSAGYVVPEASGFGGGNAKGAKAGSGKAGKAKGGSGSAGGSSDGSSTDGGSSSPTDPVTGGGGTGGGTGGDSGDSLGETVDQVTEGEILQPKDDPAAPQPTSDPLQDTTDKVKGTVTDTTNKVGETTNKIGETLQSPCVLNC